MIGHYVIKRFFTVFAVFVGIMLAIFGGLQSVEIQKRLLNCIAFGGLMIDFDDTSGIFPFNFTVKNLRIENCDMALRAASVAVELSSHLINIEKLDVHDANFELKAQTDFVISDIRYIMPIFVQKMVKSAAIDHLQVGDEVMYDICFTYNKRSGLRGLKMLTSLDAMDVSWRINKEKIMAAVKINEVLAHVGYDIIRNEVDIRADCFGKMVAFDGMYLDDSLVGRVTLPFHNEKIWSKIRMKGNVLTVEAKSEALFHATGKMSYVLGSDSILCEKLVLGGGIRVDPFTIGTDGSIREVNFFLPKGNVNVANVKLFGDDFTLGTATFAGIDLEQFGVNGLYGVLSGTGVYLDNKEKADIKVSNFSFGSLQVNSVAVNAEYSSQELVLTLAFDFMKKRNSVKSKIFLDNWMISRNSKITMETNGTLNIGTYALPENQEVGGDLTYNLKIGGTADMPHLSGKVTIKNGHYVNQRLGTYMKDITVACAIDQNVVNINKIHAKDDSRHPGKVDGRGRVIVSHTGFNADVGIKIDNLNVFEHSWLEARLSGELSLKGDLLGGAKITGALYTQNPKADISWIIASSARAIDLVDPSKNGGLKEHSSATEVVRGHWVGYPIDVAFEVRPELRITGPDIDSIWTGNAKIGGSTSNLKCDARAVLKSGKITVTDNSFGLKSGEISYDLTNLFVTVAAEKTVEEKTVGAQFMQKNDISKVKFYSSPYMPQSDILSYILFDKSTSEISTSEGFILFTAMNKVTGVDGFGILGKMKTALGIDTITIKKNKDHVKGEDHDAISIGKQIGKIKVSVDQGAAKDTTGVTVETRIAKNAKITADMTGKNSFGAGISWSKRY